jgi:hypothetical protein
MRPRGYGWENVLPDYTNIRGFNYIPAFPTLDANPPDLPPGLTYTGVTSPVCIWRFWVGKDVDQQLGWLKGLGINAIRVWLSYYVWEHDERVRRATGGSNLFLDRFGELLALAEKHRIYVMPILWDERFAEPSATPYDDISEWARFPASQNVTVEWASDPSNPFNGDAYVRDVVAVGRESPALFMWDLMNEPATHEEPWLRHYCDFVRAHDPNPQHPITIGYAALTPFRNARTPALDQPTLDVLSYHPYGMFRQNVQAWTALARLMRRPPFTDREKPILVTEIGFPGNASRYDDSIAFCREMGVGAMLFQAMLGKDRFIFGDSQGIVYDDGQVRYEEDARALRAWGRAQGRLYTELTDTVQKTDFAGYAPQVLPNGFGVDAVVRALQPLRWQSRAKMTNENVSLPGGYLEQQRILFNVDVGLGYLSDFGAPRGILSAEDQAMLRGFSDEFRRRRLPQGTQPFLIGSPPVGVDWARYDALFTAWGIAMWKVIDRNGLGGQHSPRVLEEELSLAGAM